MIKMKIKILAIIFLSLIVISTTSFAVSININQNLKKTDEGAPEISWEYKFGGELRDYGMDGLETNDGYIIVGNYAEGEKGWVIKTDLEGNIILDQKYGTTDTNYFRKVIDLDDGYLIGGSSYSQTDTSRDFWVVKIFEDGSIDWSKKYGYQNSLDLFSDFTKSADGGYVLIGSTLEGNDYGSPLIIKINSEGAEESRFIYDRNTDDNTEDTHLFDIDTTSDGGYVCTGYIQKPFLGDYDFFLLKLDEKLNEEWNKLYDSGTGFDWAYDVCETGSGYILVGDYYYEKSGKPHEGAWVVASDLSGNLLWQEKFQGINNHASAFFIEKLNDGNYIVTGEVGQPNDNFHTDLWVLKLDRWGSQIWSFETGEEYSDDGSCVIETRDGGYFVVGTLMTEYNGYTFNQDLWIIKLITSSASFKPDEPYGKTYGETGTEYKYTTRVIHPEGLDVKFGWDWTGDKVVDEWTEEYYSSGETIETYHSWSSDGMYLVHVKAKDINGLESSWSDPLNVVMPRSKSNFVTLFKVLFENNPFLTKFIQFHSNFCIN
jgi:hypothetical protein